MVIKVKNIPNLGWHSYSVYDYDELSDNFIGD